MSMEDWKMKFKNRQAALQRYINESAVPVIKEGENKAEKAKQFFKKYDEEPKGFLAWINHFLKWIMNPVGKLRNVAYAAETVNALSDLIAVVEKSSQMNAQASSSSSQAPPPVLSKETQTTLNTLFVEKRKKLGYGSTVRNELILLEKELKAFQSETQTDWVLVSGDLLSTHEAKEVKTEAPEAPVAARPASPLPEEHSSSPTAAATEETIATPPSIPDEIIAVQTPEKPVEALIATRSPPLPRNSKRPQYSFFRYGFDLIRDAVLDLFQKRKFLKNYIKLFQQPFWAATETSL